MTIMGSLKKIINLLMRLDKYLKVSRLIKRRTVAKDASSNEFVYVNGKTQKPGHRVKVGDIVEVKFATKLIKVEVTSIIVLKNELMYKLISETKVTT